MNRGFYDVTRLRQKKCFGVAHAKRRSAVENSSNGCFFTSAATTDAAASVYTSID